MADDDNPRPQKVQKNSSRVDGGGLRFNQGKDRFDLIPNYALEQLAKVLTKGAEKYGERNWERGMAWSKVMASLERHLHAWKRGEDFDPETGLLHMAHLLTNATFLLEYYRIFPSGDDRSHWYFKAPKIGLDIDEVLADFVGHYTNRFNLPTATHWRFDKDIKERMEQLKEDKDFWMSIPVITLPKDIPFEPTCYITSRPIPVEWTREWLHNNGFAHVPVYCAIDNKVKAAQEAGIDWFVDDRIDNFIELNAAGICTYLFSTPHNLRYDVGHKRIDRLDQLPLTSG